MLRSLVLLSSAAAAVAQIADLTGTAVDAFTFRYIDVRTGDGPEAQPGQRYTVHYTGWLSNGTKFDSSFDRKEPLEFVQGRSSVIAGWEAGFAGMKAGGKRRLLIPWQMAYGEKGSGAIPPRADLTFDVELLRVQDVPDQPAGIDLLLPLRELHRKVVALAKAVPEEKYAWCPGPGVRSFGEVVMHVALGNQLMFDIATRNLAGEALKKRIIENAAAETGKLSKDEIVKRLDESFEPVLKYLETARAGVLATDMEFFGRSGNRRGVFAFIDTHIAEHLGQAIAYARINGIRPPWSGGE